jgi:hypothetical protein
VPKTWSVEEIAADALIAKKAFQKRREDQVTDELERLKNERFPLNRDTVEKAIECLLRCMRSKFDPQVCHDSLADLMESEHVKTNLEALRYLAYPPISEDDLKTIAEVDSLSKGLLKTRKPKQSKKSPDLEKEIADREAPKRIFEVIGESLDIVRFEWMLSPEKFACASQKDELARRRDFAVEATALLMAAQQTQTERRSNEKAELENAVKEILERKGYKAIDKKQPIPDTGTLHSVFDRGTFMKECQVITENGDFVICLVDGRFMFIECKASNSEINSRKRLNKEAVKNIKTWKDKLGSTIIGAAAIRGMFKPDYVQEAQDQGVFIFWHHALDKLEAYLDEVKNAMPQTPPILP